MADEYKEDSYGDDGKPPDKPKEEAQPDYMPIFRDDLLEGLFECNDIRVFRRDAFKYAHRVNLAAYNAFVSINDVIAGWNAEAAAELKKELTADDIGFLFNDMAWLKQRIEYYRRRLKLPKKSEKPNGDSDSAAHNVAVATLALQKATGQ